MIPLKQTPSQDKGSSFTVDDQHAEYSVSNYEQNFMPLPQKMQIIEQMPNVHDETNTEWSSIKLYLICLAVRLIVALLFTNTYHKPDQFFQGPEVAHHMVYGKGELAWEWTFKDPIRNPLFPIIFAFGYYLLKITGLHTILPLFSKAPFVQQAFIAALFDFLFVKINKHYNPKCSTKFILLLNWGSWVTFFYPSRVYVNILETVLMMTSFYLWIKRNENENYDLYSRILVGVNFAVRGTSIIFWAITWIYELFMYHRRSMNHAFKFILKNLITILFMITFSIFISFLYYKKVTWVDFNFFYYNVIKGWSKVAGESPFSEYFYKYHKKALFYLVIFEAWGIVKTFFSQKANKELKELLFLCFLALLVLSLNGHKQLRFMFVYIPYIFVFIIKGFMQFPEKLNKLRLLILLACIIYSWHSIIQSSYLIHSTVLKTASYIRDTPSITNVYYFISAFSVPMYSHIHRDNVILNQIQNPYSEAYEGKSQQNQFLQETDKFVNKTLIEKPNLSHVILNAEMRGKVKLEDYGFEIDKEFQNNVIPGFPVFEYKIILWKKINTEYNKT